MTYVNLEGLGNKPAWRVTVIALAFFVAAVWVAMVNAKPEPPVDYRDDSTDAQIVTFPRVVR